MFAANATHFEVVRFLRQSLKPCPKREGFKGRETAGFGLRAVSLPLDEVVIIFIKKNRNKEVIKKNQTSFEKIKVRSRNEFGMTQCDKKIKHRLKKNLWNNK